MCAPVDAWKHLVVEAQLHDSCKRWRAARGLITKLQSKVPYGAITRLVCLDIQQVFAAWWSFAAEARLELWSMGGSVVAAGSAERHGTHESPYGSCLFRSRQNFDSFTASSEYAFASSTSSSDPSSGDAEQVDIGWRHDHVSNSRGWTGCTRKAGVELASRVQSWESQQGCKVRLLQTLVFKVWHWRTGRAQAAHVSVRPGRSAGFVACWEIVRCCFIGWQDLLLHGRLLKLRAVERAGLQFACFLAWKSLKTSYRKASKDAAASSRLRCQEALKKCWQAWRNGLKKQAEWRKFVTCLLRRRAHQNALECLVDALEARAEREHMDQSLALSQRADKLLLLLAFVVWQFVCETSQKDSAMESLQHVLDSSDLTGKAAVADLVMQHSECVRFVATKSAFTCWLSLTNMQRQARRFSRNGLKQARSHLLVFCFTAWLWSSQGRSKQPILLHRWFEKELSSRWFHRWTWITQRLRADRIHRACKLPNGFKAGPAGLAELHRRRCLQHDVKVIFTTWALQTERLSKHSMLADDGGIQGPGSVGELRKSLSRSILTKIVILVAWRALCVEPEVAQQTLDSSMKSVPKLDLEALLMFLPFDDGVVRCSTFLKWREQCLLARLDAHRACKEPARQIKLSEAPERPPNSQSWIQRGEVRFLQQVVHAWWKLRQRARCSQKICAGLTALLDSFLCKLCFQKWSSTCVCQSWLLSWLRMLQSLLCTTTEVLPVAQQSCIGNLKQETPERSVEAALGLESGQALTPEARIDEATDGEEQPEEEQLPSVFQPVTALTPASNASRAACPRVWPSKLDGQHKPNDLCLTAAAHQLPKGEDHSGERLVYPATSREEDLRKRLYLMQGPLLRRVFHRPAVSSLNSMGCSRSVKDLECSTCHNVLDISGPMSSGDFRRWWDECLAGQLRSVERSTHMVQRQLVQHRIDLFKKISILVTDRRPCHSAQAPDVRASSAVDSDFLTGLPVRFGAGKSVGFVNQGLRTRWMQIRMCDCILPSHEVCL